MEYNQTDYISPKKDKKINFSFEGTRTNDSDTIPLKSETDSQMINLENSSSNYDNDSYNIRIGEPKTNNNENKINDKQQFFIFKLQISISLSVIYFLLFLISMPKSPVKIGEENNINLLINNNTNENINILLSNFNFYLVDKNTNQINTKENNNEINKNNNENNTKKNETLGYLLEFKVDKIYNLRWFIGFIFFLTRIICFLYSNEEIKNSFFDENRISLIQKFACLIFPLWLFYYDFKNNISYTKIKTEYIYNKTISYFITTKKSYSLVDYVEGLIPTLFYFLISIINNGKEQFIGAFFRRKKKITKLV